MSGMIHDVFSLKFEEYIRSEFLENLIYGRKSATNNTLNTGVITGKLCEIKV